MQEVVVGVITTVAGVGMILLRRPLSRWAIRGQNATWGFNFGERHVRRAEVAFVLLGIFALALGVAMFTGLARFE